MTTDQTSSCKHHYKHTDIKHRQSQSERLKVNSLDFLTMQVMLCMHANTNIRDAMGMGLNSLCAHILGKKYAFS